MADNNERVEWTGTPSQWQNLGWFLSCLLVILLWVYYSALILFFGAELTQVYANHFGSKIKAS